MTVGEEEEKPFHLYASAASQQLLEPLRTEIRETLHQFVGLFKTLSPRQLIEQLKDRPLGRRQNEAPIPLSPGLDEKTGVRPPARLLLDALERTARIRCGRGIEQDRKQAGEPADRARQVDALEQVLAAVAFQRDQQRPTAGPVGERLDEGGQQHVIDLRVVDCRHLVQQRQRVVGVEPGRHGAGGTHQIHTVRMVDGEAAGLLPGDRGPVRGLAPKGC